jgi:hypothetical protein
VDPGETHAAERCSKREISTALARHERTARRGMDGGASSDATSPAATAIAPGPRRFAARSRDPGRLCAGHRIQKEQLWSIGEDERKRKIIERRIYSVFRAAAATLQGLAPSDRRSRDL